MIGMALKVKENIIRGCIACSAQQRRYRTGVSQTGLSARIGGDGAVLWGPRSEAFTR